MDAPDELKSLVYDGFPYEPPIFKEAFYDLEVYEVDIDDVHIEPDITYRDLLDWLKENWPVYDEHNEEGLHGSSLMDNIQVSQVLQRENIYRRVWDFLEERKEESSDLED